MKTIPREPVFIRHLPAALLFQGKIEKAKTIYLEWKDQAVIDGETGAETLFQELFLEDLQLLEEAEITHPEVEQAKALLDRQEE